MKIKKYYFIIPAIGVGLLACNSGGGGSVDSTTSTGTDFSSVSQITSPTGSSCFSISNPTATIGAWWVSGGFSITNTCTTNQLVNGTVVNITSKDYLLNASNFSLNSISNLYFGPPTYWAQSVGTFSAGSSGSVALTINVQNNVSGYIQPNTPVAVSFGYNPGGKMPGAFSYAINNGDLPTQSGNINVSVDTSPLKSICTGSTTCNIPISLNGQNGTFNQTVLTVTNSNVGQTLSTNLKNLNPSTYSLTVQNSSLPSRVSFSSTPITLNSGATTNLSGAFSVTPVTTGALSYTLIQPSGITLANNSLNVSLANSGNTIIGSQLSLFGSVTNFSNITAGNYTLGAFGVADAVKGIYYAPLTKSVTVTAGTTNALGNISLTSATTAQLATNLVVSGLDSGEKATITLTDSMNYTINSFDVTSGTTAIKLLKDDNIVVNVKVPGTNKYNAVNPINYTASTAGSINVNITKVVPPVTSGIYSYSLSKDQYSNSVVGLTLSGFTANVDSVTVGANVAITTGGFPVCFGVPAGSYQIKTTNDSTSKVVYTTFSIPSNSSAKFSVTTNPTCGNFLYSDTYGYSYVMPSNLSGKNIMSPKVVSVSVVSSGKTYNLAEKTPALTLDPGNGNIIEGYYASWSIYNGMNFSPEQIPYSRLNSINYSFVYFDPSTGNIYAGDYNADASAMPTIAQAIRQYCYTNGKCMKGLLAFGGWTNFKNGSPQDAAKMFYDLTSSQTKIDTFASQSVQAMRQLGFSGIVIDWEWWSSTSVGAYNAAYGNRMLSLYKAVRSELDKQGTIDGKKYELSIAVSVGKDKIDAQENAIPGFWNQVYALVDRVGLMSYDIHGDWDVNNPSYFQAPWQMEPGNPYQSTGYDIKTALTTYKNYITTATYLTKFVMGIPAYGRASTIASTNNQGLLQTITATALGQRTVEASMWDYKCIINSSACAGSGQRSGVFTLVNQQNDPQGLWAKYSKDYSYEPWGYGTIPGNSGPVFITYDDTYSVTQKVKRAKELKLGGMMLWEIDGDSTDANTSLFQAMVNEYAK